MDIFNRPPAISEDTLQYNLYPPPRNSDKLSVTTFATCIQTYVDTLLPNFLWHRDQFELKVVRDSDTESEGWMLQGRMRVGDCVDDEWCAVWLLREVSRKWDFIIQVFDSDGDFLLIEAAECLPPWVSPSNSENRVWIYSSRIHLVPISHVSPPSRKRQSRKQLGSKDSDDDGDNNDADWIAVPDALKVVRDTNVDTNAPADLESTIWRRISGYPSAARDHIHVTKAHIPVDIARALSANPSLIQKPVETFYTRDANQLRAAHRMNRFPPTPSILTMVKLTRTAYAQLMGQKFYPPKVFGRWTERQGTKEWRWRDIGMKIATGFEMLYQESKDRKNVTGDVVDSIKSSAEARKDALRRNPDYVKYIQNLTSVGYFKAELEGSRLWMDLEDKAAAMFLNVRREDNANRESFASLVTAAISQAKFVPSAPIQEVEDSDEWLNVDALDFDNMLEKTMGTKKKAQLVSIGITEGQEVLQDHVTNEQATRLQNLAEKVEKFVEGEGDLDGARFEDEEFSEEEFSDEKMSDSDEEMMEGVDNDVALQEAMDSLVPSLPQSEYGKMPASFHNNSQRVAPSTLATDIVETIPAPGSSTFSPAPPRSKPIRTPIIPRDRYDGVDSDDETDSEDDTEGDEQEEDRPQVIGDLEIDMGEEEEEFLDFSKKALGISDVQWSEIVRDRKGRGAYLPASAVSDDSLINNEPTVTKKLPGETTQSRAPAPGPRPNTNPNLDSFEAVMQAMDAELARSRKAQTKPSEKLHTPPSSPDNGKGKAKIPVEDEEDIEAVMDAEIRAILERGKDDDDEREEEDPMDYNLIKNFLESFKSQGGLSGPVSNLAGRLQPGWTLPRDET